MNTKGHPWWKPKLDRKITSSGGSQMQDVWIVYNLRGAVGENIAEDILINGYERLLIGVSKSNDMIFNTLNSKAKTVQTNIKLV